MEKTASQINELFRTRLAEGGDGIKTAAMAGAAYIKTKLREESFARKVLPPEIVTQEELQRNEEGDGLYKLVDIEPDSSAVQLSFRAEAPARYVYGTRAKVRFFKVSSERFEKQETELLAYEMPITKILEQNSVFDIQEREDRVFYAGLEAAVAGTARDSVSTQVTLTPTTYLAACKLLDGNKLKSNAVLMTEEMFLDIQAWTADQAWEGGERCKITKFGYEEPVLFGKSLILTNKGDIVSNREMWVFTKPEFMGRFYILEDTKFWIDKRADMIEWMSWETIGMNIINSSSVGRVTFTG